MGGQKEIGGSSSFDSMDISDDSTPLTGSFFDEEPRRTTSSECDSSTSRWMCKKKTVWTMEYRRHGKYLLQEKWCVCIIDLIFITHHHGYALIGDFNISSK